MAQSLQLLTTGHEGENLSEALMKKRMYGRLVVGLMVIALVAMVMGNLTWASDSDEPLEPTVTDEPADSPTEDPLDPVSSPACYPKKIPGTFKILSVEMGITGIPLKSKVKHVPPCKNIDCSAEFLTLDFSIETALPSLNYLRGGRSNDMAMIKIEPVYPGFANLLIAAQQSGVPVKMKKSSCTGAIESITLGQ